MDLPGGGTTDAGPIEATAQVGPSGPTGARGYYATRDKPANTSQPRAATHTQPTGSASPGPTVPGPATGGKPSGRRGVAIDWRRGGTSKGLLTIAWTYPVREAVDSPNNTVTAQPLTFDEALAAVAGDDPRPLLVLRECERCRGTDHALLSDLDDEQTALMTQWFHCVKLPPNVLETRQPFRVLFSHAQSSPQCQGKWTPHLFLCSRDGSNLTVFSGAQSQPDVWAAMFTLIEQHYATDAHRVVRDLRAALSRFDELDEKERACKLRLAAEQDKNGADTERAKHCLAELEAVRNEREVLLARERLLAKLTLRPAAAAAPAAEAGK
jgi:hypothetical protein